LRSDEVSEAAIGKCCCSTSHYRKAEASLRRCQRRVSRRKKGSHRQAAQLVRAYDSIAYEALQTANRVKNHHLAKRIHDAGWSQFLTILTFKAASAGKRVQAVDPAYTSQRCSGCAAVVYKGLSVRWHACQECGTSLHRDHNAAVNILRLAQQIRSRPGEGRQA